MTKLTDEPLFPATGTADPPVRAAVPLAAPAIRRPTRLPPLNLFRVFDAAARHGNFTTAAEELCVTQSAVSQQIRQLEELLEVRLFRRMPRRVELTREGTALASAVGESMALLVRACERIVDPKAPVVLCVNAPPSIASRWLVPRLKRFMQLQPQVKVTLLASSDPVDFDRQDIDVAIRWGNGVWPNARVEMLAPDRLFPVCSPALLREGPPLARPGDIVHHTLLQVVSGSYWGAWLAAAGVGGLAFEETLYFNDAGLMLDAAVQGQGVALASPLLAESDLKAGRLVRPFDLEIETGSAFYVLTSPDFSEKPAVAEFRSWIGFEGRESG
ncbi:transcriptional regulator GcvA [Ancylobacter sp. 6x-1]|uniref:Transcriptional regulator GcvA n=1 Tax=Ancylobacter crimeensis TaxID=2579147 RepID=A0ABT0DG42_9HYPH|nr:transcriptional regulator GcvA [Ancylobacter crimeensis]MCK0198936.1 transcriptional regulator GcvA [Ancylobacter crimeensis]